MKTTKEQQNGEMKDNNLPQDVANQTESVNESRRRFAKSSLAVSGVLLTLASRPSLGSGGGFGGGGMCKSPSGLMSGNLSVHGSPQRCQGRTPGYWCNHYTWPSPYKTGTCTNTQHKQDEKSWSNTGSMMFNHSSYGFNCNNNGARYKPYSMMRVMLLGGRGDPNQLGAHCVAALLNAQMGWTPVLTVAQVKNIFNEWNDKGYFEPTAGVKWYAGQIVDYLKSTMPL